MTDISKIQSKAKDAFTKEIAVPYAKKLIPKYMNDKGKIKSEKFIDDVMKLLAKFVLGKNGGITKGNLGPSDFTKSGLENIIAQALGIKPTELITGLLSNPLQSAALLDEQGKKYSGNMLVKGVDAYKAKDAYKELKDIYLK